MPAFKPPQRSRKQDKTWIRTAGLEFRNPDIIWTDLWPRFNYITIPVLDEDAFYYDALSAAKEATDRKQLEELLAKKRDARMREMEEVMHNIGLAIIYETDKLPCSSARNAALKVGRTGSLDSILQLVGGFVFGWEDGSEKHSPQPITATDERGGDDNDDGNRGNSNTGDDQLCSQPNESWSGTDVGLDEWEADETPPESQQSPSTSMGEHDTTAAATVAADVGQLPSAALDDGAPGTLPAAETLPAANTSAPQPSLLIGEISGTVSTQNHTAPAASPNSLSSAPRTPPRPPNPVHKPSTSSYAGQNTESRLQRSSDLATGFHSAKRPRNSDDENSGGGDRRRKRRATDGDPVVGGSEASPRGLAQ